MNKTIKFDSLMALVRYHDLGVSEKYVFTLDGKRHVLDDTAKVIPAAKKLGYTVIDKDGRKM